MSNFRLSASVSVAVPIGAPASAELVGLGNVVQITNPNNTVAYVAFGAGAQAAIGGQSSVVILPMSSRRFTYFESMRMVSAILLAGSGIVVFEVGDFATRKTNI